MIEKIMLLIQHVINPLHVFCRLMDIGLNRQTALSLSRLYEHIVFKRLFFPVTRFPLHHLRFSK